MTWDFFAWPPAPPSSRAPRPPCPAAWRAGRTRSTRRRTSRLRPAAAAVRQQQQYAPRPPAAAPRRGRPDRRAAEPRPAEQAGRAHGRGVRGGQGQDPRHLTGSRRWSRSRRTRGWQGSTTRSSSTPATALGGVPRRALARRRARRPRRARRLLRHRPPRGGARPRVGYGWSASTPPRPCSSSPAERLGAGGRSSCGRRCRPSGRRASSMPRSPRSTG